MGQFDLQTAILADVRINGGRISLSSGKTDKNEASFGLRARLL